MAKKQLSYKEAISRIEELIEKIDSDDIDVDELSENVREVSALIALCKEKLHKTETEVQKILDDIDE